MATFSTNSTGQRDVLPTNYSSDQGHGSYPESSVTDNVLHLNYISSGPFSDIFAGYAQPLENSIELPILTTMMSHDSSAKDPDLATSNLGEHSYNVWRDGRNEMSFMQMIAGSQNVAGDIIHSSVNEDAHMGGRTHLGILNGQNLPLQESRLPTLQGQGLSLSLNTQIPLRPFQQHSANSDTSILSSYQAVSGSGGPSKDDNSRSKCLQSNASPCGLSSITSTIPNSKYLKATQQLLDEVVSVRNALKQKAERSQCINNSSGTTDWKDNDGVKSDGMSLDPQDSNVHSSGELSATERQDLQNKMTKLLAMLDEVDRRYKQYYHQMQIVVSSFDFVAGCGAAKPYTALALQTISRQFHCLRDAINGQIRSARKNLGEQDSSSSKGGSISRLRYIDQPLRQQRAIQQLGMIPQKAWRPQRGLPETSVSILRAWLFEHFLHPYPTDSEKLMLARQTGLTRGQVSNWFINARVRLWKPMIEEMYKEETGDTEMDSNSSSDNAPKDKDEIRSPEEREDIKGPTGRCSTSQFNDSSKSNSANVDMGTPPAGFRSEANANDNFINLMLKDERRNIANCGLLHEAFAQSSGSGQFMAYKMAELERYRNNGMSLTLGLQHCDGSLPGSNGQQAFLPAREEQKHDIAPPLEADAAGHDCINLMDQRNRIGPTHLLHDFVA